MKRKTPAKVAVMKIRIAQRDTANKLAEKERAKCLSCNGAGYVGYQGMIGCCTCNRCNGTGKHTGPMDWLSILDLVNTK
jgi:DnaJ-class molecular chaperone